MAVSVLRGEGPPARSLGRPGDFYIDVLALALHGPKTGRGWPDGEPLRPEPPGPPTPDISDDLPLATSRGDVLTTGSGARLMGDRRDK